MQDHQKYLSKKFSLRELLKDHHFHCNFHLHYIEKIYVSDKQVIDGKKIQKISIIWNYIGEFNIST